MNTKVVDLFCGIGGLSYGFKSEGFNVIAGIDSDTTCKFAFESNVGGNFIDKPLEEISDYKLRSFFNPRRGNLKILVGCAPCQPFSIYTTRYVRDENEGLQQKWGLLDEFRRAVRVMNPDVVSMENVARVKQHTIFEDFVSELESLGYYVNHKVVRAHDYGVPQRRSRLVLLASKFGEIDLISPTHAHNHRTVRQAIGHLPAIEAGTSCQTDRLHRSRGLTEINLRRLRATKEGGSWKDWDESLQLKCHKKSKGKSFRSVYGRMQWDMPSPVITTQCLGIGNGRFGHPSQDRAISIREAALLQTFPKKFRFVDPAERVIGLILARQIGNAVPVRLGSVIARSIKHHLAEVAE